MVDYRYDARKIDEFALHLFNLTRSIGMEHGSELLLHVLYLRWTTEQVSETTDHRRTWRTIRNDLSHGVVRPGPLLEQALAEQLEGWPIPELRSVDDGSGIVERVVFEIDGWPFETHEQTAVRTVASLLFEAVLRLRSDRLSRAGGEFETPTSIAKLMTAAVVEPGARVLDPACGIGTTLMHAREHKAGELVGWDLNEASAARAVMRLRLAAIDADISLGDSLIESSHADPRFDCVVAQPPFGVKLSDTQWHELDALGHDWLRFGRPPRSSADFVWLQRCLSLLTPQGRAAVLLPPNSLFRSGMEAEVRRGLLREGLVEAIVGLPPGMLANTGIGCTMWLLRGGYRNPTPPPVLLVSAASFASGGRGTRVELSDDGVADLSELLLTWRADAEAFTAPPHIARSVHLDELDETVMLVPERFLVVLPDEAPPRPTPPRRLLTRLRVENVKAFADPQDIELAPITLIYGPNSAGKSTLLQTLLLLKQSLGANTLVTQGDLTDAGSFEGFVHRHDTKRTVRIGVTFGSLDRWDIPDGVPDPSLLRAIDFSFATDGADLPEHRTAHFSCGPIAFTFNRSAAAPSDGAAQPFSIGTDQLDDLFNAVAEGTFLFPFDSRREYSADPEGEARRLRSRQSNGRRARKLLDQAGMNELIVAASGLLPTASVDLDPARPYFAGADDRAAGIVYSYVKRAMQAAAGTGDELRALFDELTYLGPLRSAPQRTYNRAGAAAGAGNAGENIALHLFDNASEVEEVNHWLRELQISYSLKLIPVRAVGGTAIIGDNVAMVLTDTRSKVDVSPADVGFGVSQILPIVVQLLARQESVVCIEQPEIHLHPKLQTALADLIIQSAAPSGGGNQVIAETHSEHVLLRLQRRIREQEISADDVAVLYVDQDEDGVGHVKPLRLDSQGFFIDPWPAGFFDEPLDEIFGSAG